MTIFDEITDGAIDFFAGMAVQDIIQEDDIQPSLVLLELIDEYH